jgi:hypothetical protein
VKDFEWVYGITKLIKLEQSNQTLPSNLVEIEKPCSIKSNHAFTPRLFLSTLAKVAQSIYFYLSENPQRSKG